MERNTKQFLFQVKSLISSYRKELIFLSGGLLLVTVGIILKNQTLSTPKVEVLQTPNISNNIQGAETSRDLIVDVSGEVLNPGVYTLKEGDRVEDALMVAGGITKNANKNWVNKNLNKAAKLVDGQKIFIPQEDNSNVAQSSEAANSSLININEATSAELDSLSGIGQVYAQSIIDHRPYSDISELVSKDILKQSLYDKIKDKISVY